MTKTQFYDRSKSYKWNYDNAPEFTEPVDPNQSSAKTEHRFLGIPCRSPLGVPAGPLLNSDWILHYSNLGYDILTYKTVRSRQRDCYPFPNLLPVDCGQLEASPQVNASDTMRGSWAISFGMPSKAPDVWTVDVQRARQLLPEGKLLTVSVVATPDPDWSLEQIAEDYASVAVAAVEAGADTIEANFSCPNVSSADGQLFQNFESSSSVARQIRQAIGEIPLTLKIGHVTDSEDAVRLLEATAESIDGLAMVNCISANVSFSDGQQAFEGSPRGIGGVAIHDAVLKQVRMFAQLAVDYGVETVGVGGVSTPSDYREMLKTGVTSVQIATAAMNDPDLAMRIKHSTPGQESQIF